MKNAQDVLQLCTLGDIASTLQFMSVLYLGSPVAYIYGKGVLDDLKARRDDCLPRLRITGNDAEVKARIGTTETSLDVLENSLSTIGTAEGWIRNAALAVLHFVLSLVLSAFADVKVESIGALAFYVALCGVLFLFGFGKAGNVIATGWKAWDCVKWLEHRSRF